MRSCSPSQRIVEFGAAPLLRHDQTAGRRKIDPGHVDLQAVRIGQHQGEFRFAVHKVSRAVHRVDDPERIGIINLADEFRIDGGRLLPQKPRAGNETVQPAHQFGFRGPICLGHEIAGRFLLDMVIAQILKQGKDVMSRDIAHQSGNVRHIRRMSHSAARLSLRSTARCGNRFAKTPRSLPDSATRT